jgi:hypothetical protein
MIGQKSNDRLLQIRNHNENKNEDNPFVLQTKSRKLVDIVLRMYGTKKYSRKWQWICDNPV